MTDIERVKEIARGLDVLHGGKLVEVRAIGVKLKHRTVTMSGYYRDYRKAAEAALYCESLNAEGVYQTLQVIDERLYARAPDELVTDPKKTTSDANVIEMPWLLIDVDPVRPSGVSSTDKELREAIHLRNWIADMEEGTWLKAMSGNGGHLLSKDAKIRSLDYYAALYGTDTVGIDKSVNKPAQLTKLYGTLTRKGFHLRKQPHRRSQLEETTTCTDLTSTF